MTGHFWVADTGNSRVQELDANGAPVSVQGGFNAPRGIAAGPDGAIYVADTGNNRVQRRDPLSGAWSVATSACR